MLGLSTQVPAKAVYLADGIDRTKTFTIGSRTLIFKASRPRDFGGNDNPISAVVIQALRHFGKKGIGQEIIAQLRARLPEEARQQFLHDVALRVRLDLHDCQDNPCNESGDGHG